jgi:hypothetical protein
MSDFSEPPPGRRAVRPEYEGLSPGEIQEREVERLWGSTKRDPPPPVWSPAAPSPPAILALLQYAHDPLTGRPAAPRRPLAPDAPSPFASDSELVADSGRRHRLLAQFAQEDDQYMERFRYWAGLDTCQKTQLAADARYGKEDAPCWSVVCAQDPVCPPLVLKAPHAAEAVSRYRTLCGIRGFDQRDDFAEPLVATPYTPPEVPNGSANGG